MTRTTPLARLFPFRRRKKKNPRILSFIRIVVYLLQKFTCAASSPRRHHTSSSFVYNKKKVHALAMTQRNSGRHPRDDGDHLIPSSRPTRRPAEYPRHRTHARFARVHEPEREPRRERRLGQRVVVSHQRRHGSLTQTPSAPVGCLFSESCERRFFSSSMDGFKNESKTRKECKRMNPVGACVDV